MAGQSSCASTNSPEASPCTQTEAGLCLGLNGTCVPWAQTVNPSGKSQRLASLGRSTLLGTADWWSQPMATEPSAGTAWTTAVNSWRYMFSKTCRTGLPGPPKGFMGLLQGPLGFCNG